MTVRFASCFMLMLLSVAWSCALFAVDDSDKDIIVRKNGTKVAGYVETETMAGILYRTWKPKADQPMGKPNVLKINEFGSIFYYGMDSGPYGKAVSERDAGNYEAAAEFFNQAALAGNREWEKVYGAMGEGECWELAQKYGEAAKAYATVADGYGGDEKEKKPPHRLWLDAKYHYGMALAQNKDEKAATVADELVEFGRAQGMSAAEGRANAIRAAIAANADDLSKFTEFMKKSSLRPMDEMDTWFHFKLYCAETYRNQFKKTREAAAIYRDILNNLRDDPARQAQISLGLGLTLIESDTQSALVELLKLDVMPYGSQDQKCEARYHAGRLLWEEAQAIKSNADAMKDERKAQFVIDTERAARLVVSAAASGPPANPNVELAKSLLATFGPDPDAVEEKPKPKKPAAKPEPKEDPKKPGDKKKPGKKKK